MRQIHPIIYAHVIGAFFILVALVFVIVNYKKLFSIDIYHKIILLLIASAAITAHGISHDLLEKQGYKMYVPF